MKKRELTMTAALGMTVFMLSGMSVMAADTELTPGVTVVADENSKTGYTTTFVYEDAEAGEVKLAGTFAFYKSGKRIGAIPNEMYHVQDWEPGMFRTNSTDLAVEEEMTKVEGTDYWTISLELPSGHYLYNYMVDDSEDGITDPANGPMASTAESGSVAKLSTVDVPYDEKQGDSIDFDFMLQQDGVAAGEVTFADYEDVNGDQAPLAIYLPADYDAEREEPYKVLYLSHGGGGNETEWFSSGSTNIVFDNLIAEGAVEPTIVVTMSNGVYSWDYDVINENVMEHIIPFMEENYNIGTEPSDRAFAGLSMGGMTTSNMYYRNLDQFGYYGIFSGSDASWDLSTLDQDGLKAPVIMTGAGCYDMAYLNDSYLTDSDITTQGLMKKLDEQGVEYDFYEVKGGHDWSTWPQLIKIFAENYLWK